MANEYISLDGKRVIFIGNSFIYYGCAVLAKSASGYPTLRGRTRDGGYFYRIAKSHGEDVSVTNWTFGGHRFSHLFSGEPCTYKDCAGSGVAHLNELGREAYDYVILSEGSGLECDAVFMKNVDFITSHFLELNPKTKFVYLVHPSHHGYGVGKLPQPHVLSALSELYERGFIIVDWGRLVKDIAEGAAVVQGAVEKYSKNTFIVSQSESDGYHPNQLSGYICALMTYSAITGRSAVMQSYDFVGNREVSKDASYRTFEEYKAKCYTLGETNYDRVFSSPSDMLGIQMLIDEYLLKKDFLNYGEVYGI